MTYDTWHVTHHMVHVGGGETKVQLPRFKNKYFHLILQYLKFVENIFTKDHLLTQGVCRTAPDTLGL